MVRRLVAGAAGAIVLILVLFLFKGCLDSRKQQAFTDYVAEVRDLVRESDRQGDILFTLLSDPAAAGSAVEVENQLNAFRNEAGQFVERAKGIDRPDELARAHDSLVEVLRFRSDGVSNVADLVPTVLTDQGDRAQSTEEIAGSMQILLTSDVVFSQRFAPFLEKALAEQELREERIRSRYLKDIEFLQPDVVADRIGSGGGGADRASEDAAPGLHGNGLGTVTLAGQALAPGGSASITLGEDLEFDVQVANSGENTETDVQVNVTIGAGGEAIKLESVLDEIAAGETKSVQVPLTEQPPTGQNVPIQIEIEAVPGEEMTDNNQGEFTAIFTR